MTGQFAHRVALVTGGTSGIGLAIVQLLAREGARVVFCGRNSQPGREVERALLGEGCNVLFVPCDVTQEPQVEQLLVQVQDWGGNLDLAVNSAGISPRRSPLVDSTLDAYEAVFAVNVRGTFLSLKHEMRAMAGRGGTIVNLASVLGIRAVNLNHALYTASKHAVIGLTKTAALEGAPRNIRVNAVCPGGIDTPIHSTNTASTEARAQMAALHPLGRLGTADEVAWAVCSLLSPGAGFVTGAVVSVDGGASL